MIDGRGCGFGPGLTFKTGCVKIYGPEKDEAGVNTTGFSTIFGHNLQSPWRR